MPAHKDKLLIDRVAGYLAENSIDFTEENLIIRNIKARKEGKEFTIEENIKGLVYALLSNQRKWSGIAPKLEQIDNLFFNYDKDKILGMPAEYFCEGIFSLKCGNIATKKQMMSLKHNIDMLMRIASEYGSLDSFYESAPAHVIAKKLSYGKYKLKHVGYTLAWEFLRNMGIDGAKPDLHMRRIFGRERLGYARSPIATEDEVIGIVDDISRNTNYLKSYIDSVLWCYCADGYGEVCTAEPKCHRCVIKEYCNYPSA